MTKALGKPARERRERLVETIGTLERMVSRFLRQGLDRSSAATRIELDALAQAARLAGLIHLERDVTALATLVGHYLDRDPNFRMTQVLSRLRRIHTGLDAARQVADEGVDPRERRRALGEARRTYEEVGTLAVQPLTATGWVTDSDFVGVTILMAAGDELRTVNLVRPASLFGTDPRRLYRMQVADTVLERGQDLAHGAFVFHPAKMSSDGRLSLHNKLEVHAAPWSARPLQARAVHLWAEAVPRLRAEQPYLLLRMPRFEGFRVDRSASVCTGRLIDGSGAVMHVRLPLRPENNLWIDNLLAIGKGLGPRPSGVFGKVTARPNGLSIEPSSALFDAPVKLRGMRQPVDLVHLSLESIQEAV